MPDMTPLDFLSGLSMIARSCHEQQEIEASLTRTRAILDEIEAQEHKQPPS